MIRRIHILIVLLITVVTLQAQAPAGYYSSADGLSGDELKAALHDIIKDHTAISYQQIWNAFKNTDNKGNNVVWDMYSDGAGYTYYYNNSPSDQCGEYESEGDCFNREHSWPKNWFNGSETSTPGRDLFHIFPTDGFVNAQRSNYPFGEVNNATWTSQNGSKLGSCKSSLGYTGTVFEPVDDYKGDFARAYFYMSVRYMGEDSDWGSSGMTNKSEIKDWAIAMLLNWHRNDPVSEKEIARNNVVYNSYQHNRNPFIDNPDYAEMIWNPSWSSTYQIAVASNPVVGGEVSLMANVNQTVSVTFSERYSSTTNLNGVNIALDDNASVVFNKLNGSNYPTYYTSGTAVRAYGGNNFVVSTTAGSITTIKLTYGSSDGSNAITTNVGTFSDGTWTGDAASVTFTIGGTSGNRRIKAIDVTYSCESAPAQQLTCTNGSTATITAIPNIGYHFVNWTKNNIVISTNPIYVFTVSENATYTSNFEINTYEISVAANPTDEGMAFIGDAPSPTQTVSIDFSVQGYANSQEITYVTLDDNISVTFNQGTNSQNKPKYFDSGKAIRCYGGNNFKVDAGTRQITSIVLTFGSGDGSNTITTNVSTFQSPTWNGDASSVTFTIGGTSGNRRIKAITVTYSGGAPAQQGTFEHGSDATITAIPNDGYFFINWTKAGVVVSTATEYTFTVTESAEYIANFSDSFATQTIALAAGWNWVSFNVDITLSELQTALANALPGTSITISGKNTISQYDGSVWSGYLNTLDVAQMYMIQVDSGCEITFEGMPVNPAEHQITILGNNFTWIGIPLDTAITVEEAFAGTAVEGDVITGRNSNAIYVGGHWRGHLTILEPGKGYIYKSAVPDDRPFSFNE